VKNANIQKQNYYHKQRSGDNTVLVVVAVNKNSRKVVYCNPKPKLKVKSK
jgi:hypothetical protein